MTNKINEEEKATIDKVQDALDVIGVVPGVGEFADGINGLISIGRGDMTGAALSFVSMVPGIGDVVGKGGKIVRDLMDDDEIDAATEAGAEEIVKKSAKADDPEPTFDKIKKAGEKMQSVINTVSKKAGDVKALHKAVVDGDLEGVEKVIGKKIPDEYREQATMAIKAAGEKIKDVDFKTALKDVSDVADVGKELEEKTEGESQVSESLKYDLFYRAVPFTERRRIWTALGEALNEQNRSSKK